MSDRIAFWDIDGTLMSESMERHFLRYLRAQRHVTVPQIVANLMRLSLRVPRPRWYQVKLAYLRGKRLSDVERWIADCWEAVLRHNLYPVSLAEFESLKSQGYRLILLTGTPIQLAQPLADHLGATDIIAAIPEVRDDRLTGRLLAGHPYSELKALYAEKWCKEHGFDISQTTAYANHYGDRYLLEHVGTPVAVNPDPQLAGLAQKNGWRIMNSAASRSS